MRSAHDELKKVQGQYERLTAKEKEVLLGVSQGKPNKIIAHDLSLSTRTIEIHRAHVMEKMEADTLSSLMRYVSVLEGNSILDRTQCTT